MVRLPPFPGLTILPFEPGMDMESFRDLLQNVISELYQNQSLVLHSKHNTSHRSPNSPRDEWAPDHYWHSDQSYGKKRPYATALYGNHIEGAVAGTNFIDTQKLLSYIAIDDPDLFAQLKDLSCVFFLGQVILTAQSTKQALKQSKSSQSKWFS
jgi:hypothetical protein